MVCHGSDLHRHLELDHGVARQRGHAEGSADVTATLAEDLDQEIGSAIDYLRGIGKAGDRVDVSVDGDDLLDPVEGAKCLPENGQLRECAAPRGSVSLFDGAVLTDDASHNAVLVGGDYARKKYKIANNLGR